VNCRQIAADWRSSKRRRWHTASFRWLYGYTAVFGISLTLLVGFIAWIATDAITQDTDSIMGWQLTYFESIPDDRLADAIRTRLEHERMHMNYYGLFCPDGTYVAGDMLVAPANFPLDRRGYSENGTLSLREDGPTPTMRAMGEARPNGMHLIVARDMTSVFKIREIVVRSLVLGGLGALAVATAGSIVLGMRQLARAREIRRVTAGIALGDLSQRVPIGGRDELDMLAHLVNHMLDEVERLMGEVKGACDGIAHDLRTPLVHVRTLLGRVGERETVRQDPQGAQMIEHARVETDRLLERFRAMLRISEIGTLQRRGGFAIVDLQELVGELGELYEPLAESRDLAWHVSLAPVELIHGDRALLFEAFSNLIDNAIKFAPQGGTVIVKLGATSLGPLLQVTDDGRGIPHDERAAVLQRFYRTAGARHTTGSGLGLSIVAAVIRVHDFALHIADGDPCEKTGTCMSVACWPATLVNGV
jgi:signal transduction histidine kinase